MEPTVKQEQEANLVVSGDEARVLMMALATSPARLPSNNVVQLYLKLNQINQVQPPNQS